MTNKNNRIVGPILKNLVRQIAYLYERDIITILVSSGSAIAGKEVLGDCSAVDPTTRRQVFSSVGQPRLMRHYYSMFHDFGMRCAQVLATKRDFATGVYRDNMINCYEALLDEGIVPIANEDDAVSLTKSMFTDNDELASLVAELVDADMLIMLTDTDGLYTGHPDADDSELLHHVNGDQNVEKYVQASEKGRSEERRVGKECRYTRCGRDWSSDVCSSDLSLTKSMFTDNDELASLVAELVDADMLIMLTDTDGLYTGHPDADDSELLHHVNGDQNVEKYVQASEKGEGEGRGGMGSKLKIAKLTANKNIPTYIANGKEDDIIIDILEGKKVGTKFV